MRKEPASASLHPRQPCRPDAPRCKRQSARRWRPPAAGRRRPHGRRRAANGDVVHGKRRGCAPIAAAAGHRAGRLRVASWRRVATFIVADAATATVPSLSGRAAAATTSPRSPPPRTGGVRVDEGPPPRPARGRRRSRPPSPEVAQPMLSSPHPPPLPSYVVHLPTSLPRSGPPARSRPRNQLSPPSRPKTLASPPCTKPMKPPPTTKPPTPQPRTVPLAPPPLTDQLAPSLQPQPPKKEALDGGGETQWGRGERGTRETRTSRHRATWSSIKVPLSGHLSRGAGETE
ncbi:hypothetical protein BU14_0937s0002 [Porphyra umbilicalis]|uniref:Uncharacterized protein n=1 Tax=Porphyra umbilicalis TaxID=2786 RepID=A0A1X6NN91_PORUM|nr:hypothetical protein BU14_0937s0002 [Porphyra umbilicalis]|eukprot:OSX70055.1 hypothetical protein BU14_0937s0002 [Porphyra umbilicalis]